MSGLIQKLKDFRKASTTPCFMIQKRGSIRWLFQGGKKLVELPSLKTTIIIDIEKIDMPYAVNPTTGNVVMGRELSIRSPAIEEIFPKPEGEMTFREELKFDLSCVWTASTSTKVFEDSVTRTLTLSNGVKVISQSEGMFNRPDSQWEIHPEYNKLGDDVKSYILGVIISGFYTNAHAAKRSATNKLIGSTSTEKNCGGLVSNSPGSENSKQLPLYRKREFVVNTFSPSGFERKSVEQETKEEEYSIRLLAEGLEAPDAGGPYTSEGQSCYEVRAFGFRVAVVDARAHAPEYHRKKTILNSRPHTKIPGSDITSRPKVPTRHKPDAFLTRISYAAPTHGAAASSSENADGFDEYSERCPSSQERRRHGRVEQ
ncbi:hypothetical protein C8R47DRAFT_1066302 [Mycena vitilis]|nr:hypothetical protein C8R47DRAFT_1066302 [Mycena vitilis]